MPTGYYSTGKTFEQAAKIMEGRAEKKLNTFLAAFESSSQRIDGDVVLAGKEGIAAKILSKAQNKKSDLIVMGSKGQTLTSWILLGSITKKVISRNHHTPLLIVKRKDENHGFWKAVKQI